MSGNTDAAQDFDYVLVEYKRILEYSEFVDKSLREYITNASEVWINSLNIKNVFDWYLISSENQFLRTKRACKQYIEQNWEKEVKESQEWKDFVRNHKNLADTIKIPE